MKWDFIAEPRCTVIHVGSGLDFWQLTTIHCFCEFENFAAAASLSETKLVPAHPACAAGLKSTSLPADEAGMLGLRRIRSLSCNCHSSISCVQLDLPRRKSGTYNVGDATNIKWFEGAVPRWGPCFCCSVLNALHPPDSCFRSHLTTTFRLQALA